MIHIVEDIFVGLVPIIAGPGWIGHVPMTKAQVVVVGEWNLQGPIPTWVGYQGLSSAGKPLGIRASRNLTVSL